VNWHDYLNQSKFTLVGICAWMFLFQHSKAESAKPSQGNPHDLYKTSLISTSEAGWSGSDALGLGRARRFEFRTRHQLSC